MQKKILLSLSFFIFFILITLNVNANTINNIDMDVYIDSSGNAIVKEVWKTNLNQGTEGYKPYSKSWSSSISDFSVEDDSGKSYESVSPWNVNGSFSKKAYKCGINNTANGIELCWGISQYGNRTYTLEYKINNFVTQYTDTQGIYFNFLNLDQTVGNVTIKIHSDFGLSLKNSRIWAFGNDGEIKFSDENIIYSSNGTLTPKQYMVALVRFESNLFDTDNFSEKSFDDIYDSAFSDSTLRDSYTREQKMVLAINAILMIIVFLIVIFIILKSIISGICELISKVIFRVKMFIAKIKLKLELRNSKIPYWREVPCDKDITILYHVAHKYNLLPIEKLKKGIIGAILLKFIKEEKVRVVKTEKGLFSLKDNNYAIDFSEKATITDVVEEKLYNILRSAAGKNKILEAKEFKKWCRRNYGKLRSWFNTIDAEARGRLDLKTNLKEEAKKILGLKKFLIENSMIKEREHLEVHVWNEYLIFAQLVDIAKKVKEQFSKLYPYDYVDELEYEDFDVIDIITDMSELGYGAMTKGIREEQRYISRSSYEHDYSGTTRESGGGGRSYSSGGSSAGGSSGGGFR